MELFGFNEVFNFFFFLESSDVYEPKSVANILNFTATKIVYRFLPYQHTKQTLKYMRKVV